MKTLALCLLAISFVACGGGVDKYNTNLKMVSDTINYTGLQSAFVVSQYESVWAAAIDARSDFNTALRTERESMPGMIESIANHKKWIDSALKTVQEDVPQESTEKLKKVMEFYGVVGRLASLSDQPQGSLLAFRNETNELGAQYQKLQDEMRIMNILSPADTSKTK